MAKRFSDICYEKSEMEKYGKGTVVCNSFQEFDEAIKDIQCCLVSPGGAGLPRSYIEQLEKQKMTLQDLNRRLCNVNHYYPYS